MSIFDRETNNFGLDDAISLANAAFGPSKQDADHTQVLFNQYMATAKRPPVFPTKNEMLASNKLSASDRSGITSTYDEVFGTWQPNADFRGAVTEYDANGNILISTFKGSTEKYDANLGVVSPKVLNYYKTGQVSTTQNANQNGLSGAANLGGMTLGSSTYIILLVVSVLIVVGLIAFRKHVG